MGLRISTETEQSR